MAAVISRVVETTIEDVTDEVSRGDWTPKKAGRCRTSGSGPVGLRGNSSRRSGLPADALPVIAYRVGLFRIAAIDRGPGRDRSTSRGQPANTGCRPLGSAGLGPLAERPALGERAGWTSAAAIEQRGQTNGPQPAERLGTPDWCKSPLRLSLLEKVACPPMSFVELPCQAR